MTTPHVVIVGAGFAGLEAAKRLADRPVRVTIVDRANHHLFQPLLYQVATAQLSPSDISAPIRSILSKAQNVSVVMAHVDSIDTVAKEVSLDIGETLAYDYLIVASGARHGYFGHDEWEQFAPGLKTLDDAIEIRRRILLALEEAEREQDPVRKRALLTFVLIGGGPTGIEMAGAISELARNALARDFRNLSPDLARIVLIEAGPRILQHYPEKLIDNAHHSLEKMGVEVWTGRPVTKVLADGVELGDERLDAYNIVWAAGVFASRLGRQLGAETDKAGRVKVETDLSVAQHRNIFVVGDLAAVKDAKGKEVPGVAPAAVQMGRHAARCVLDIVRGRETKPFRYVDKGNMATIGRAKAVVDLGWWQITGFLAWLVWCLVHVFYLIEFRNRLIVMTQWAWSYVTYRRGTRLITGSRKRLRPEGAGKLKTPIV